MFESLKQWLSTITADPELFETRERALTEAALASVLVHIIYADGHVSRQERHRFDQILGTQLKLSGDRIEALFEQATRSGSNLQDDLEVLRDHIVGGSPARHALLVALNGLIGSDGLHPAELVFLE